jgi:hypothetical protein
MMSKQLGTSPGIEEIAARLAILEILNLHSRGLDRRQAAWIKSAYWRDAVVDYGSYKGEAHAFADIVVAVLGKQYEMTQHILSNTLFDIQGHTARTESYLTAHHLLIGGREDLYYSGRYLDVLDCRDGCWKLSSRTVVMDWSRRLEVEDERMTRPFVDLAKGTNDAQDPLQQFWPQSD